MTFDTPVVALERAKSGPLVSRSQAKRVVARLNNFKEAALDFTDVPEVGPAFADEIFRVYRAANPGLSLTVIHANEAVRQMIHRAEAATRHEAFPDSSEQAPEKQR